MPRPVTTTQYRVTRPAFRDADVTTLLRAAQADTPTLVRAPAGSRKSRVLAQCAVRLGDEAVFLRVPCGLDQAESTLLNLSRSLGEHVLREVSEQLAREPAEFTPALQILESALDNRKLLVDDIDALIQHANAPWADLWHTRRRQRNDLRIWLLAKGSIVTSTAFLKGARPFQPLDPENPPERLENGDNHDMVSLWQACDLNPRRFHLALVRAELSGETPRPEVPLDMWTLLDEVHDLLPRDSADALRTLALHGRPLQPEVARAAGIRRGTLDTLVHYDLLDHIGGCFSADPAWARWIRRFLTRSRRRELHLRIANAFAAQIQLDDASATRRADRIAEAHRHYVRGGDFGRARTFLRYGVSLLLDDARWRSMRGRHQDAVDRYESVLQVHKQLCESGSQTGIGHMSQAYAVHYVHYNRAKLQSESLAATRRGYEESTRLWGENALFWSRLILALMYEGDRSNAMEAFRTAYKSVEDHPLRDYVLTARTVSHLLARGTKAATYFEDALMLWSDFSPRIAKEREVEQELWARLEEGWEATRLAPFDTPATHLQRPIRVRIRRFSERIVAELPELELKARGTTATDAYRSLVGRLRTRAAEALAQPAHTLTARERLSKRLYLAAVDLVASGLASADRDYTWVFGKIERTDDGGLHLDAGRSAGKFIIPEHLTESPVVSDSWWLGKVVAGPAGSPKGPLLELEPTSELDFDESYKLWREKAQGEQ